MKNLKLIIDRDGTIIEEENYLKNPNDIKFIEGSINAIIKIQKNDIEWMIASNQSGIARGLISPLELVSVNEKLIHLLNNEDIKTPPIRYCPHLESGEISPFNINCHCRKPKPGLVYSVWKRNDINTYVVIGDKLSDMELAYNLNGISCLVLTGYGNKTLNELKKNNIKVDFVGYNLENVIDWLLYLEK